MTSRKTLLQDGDITQECEILIFDPFNPRNKEITEKQVHKFLSDYGIKDKIHNLEMKLNGTKPENTEIDCIGCGS